MINSIKINLNFPGHISADSPCGNWLTYRDEKCFTVVDTLIPESGARAICQNQQAKFSLINSVEQQDLVYNYLRDMSYANNVWIGIKKNEKTFKSIEGASLVYTNWNAGRPINQSGFDCVEIDLDLDGKWVDVKCDKKSAVLCEKNQDWSFSKIENVLQDLRKDTMDKFNSMQNQFSTEIAQLKQNLKNNASIIETQKKEIDHLKQNPVPIGFIYVQLPGQKDPQALCPDTTWNNVSPNYAGLFFRAEGGGADSFGTIQEEQTQTIFVNSEYEPSHREYKVEHAINSTYSPKSLMTGSYANSDYFSLNFKHSTDEIRPRNQAIRIWIRIK